MDKKDMTLLIEAEDAINDMDRLLVQLTSMGHSDGMFNKMDNVYEKSVRSEEHTSELQSLL